MFLFILAAGSQKEQTIPTFNYKSPKKIVVAFFRVKVSGEQKLQSEAMTEKVSLKAII